MTRAPIVLDLGAARQTDRCRHVTGQARRHYVDMPTFVIIPAAIKNGSIEVDIPGRAPRSAREYRRR